MNNKKKRIFDIIQIGYVGDVASRTFDIAITARNYNQPVHCDI